MKTSVSTTQPLPREMLSRIALLLLTALFITFSYTMLHESGHGVSGLISGGNIRRINVNFFDLSAHVVIDGTFTRAQDALIAISGWALPVITYLIFLVLTRKGSNPLLLMIRWIAGISLLGSTLPWIVIPILYQMGRAPGDDVTHFLDLSGFPPLAVSAVFLVLVGAGVWMLIRSLNQIRQYIEWIRNPQSLLKQPAIFKGLAVMGIVAVIMVGLIGIINRGFSAEPIPEGYVQVTEVNLEQASPTGESICSFEKPDDGPLGIYLQAQKVKTDSIDVTLRGPDGWSFILLQGKGYQASNYVSNPAWGSLPAGSYDIVLSGSPAKGTILVYIKQ